MTTRVIFLAVSLILAWTAMARDAADVPIEDWLRQPAFDDIIISPEGNYLAVLERRGERDGLTILTRDKLKHESTIFFNEDEGIWEVLWANEDYLLIEPGFRFSALRDGLAPTGEIAVVGRDGRNLEIIFGQRAYGDLNTHVKRKQAKRVTAEIIDVLPDDDNHVLIRTGGLGRLIYNEVMRLNYRSGMTNSIASSPVRAGRFGISPDKHIRLVVGRDDEGVNGVFYRANHKDRFERTESFHWLRGAVRPVSAVGDEYMMLDDRGGSRTAGLFAWNPETNAYRTVYRNDVVDVARVYNDPDHTPWGVRYVDHFPAFHYVDEKHKLSQLHQAVSAAFPNDHVTIRSVSLDQKYATARVAGPLKPPSFLVLEVSPPRMIAQLPGRPWLKDVDLADMMPIEFTARDGLKVRGYLTLPAGKTKDLPMVVMVHGGPHGVADQWSFDPRVQLLAARGYAVLQVNYRGSGGRGRAFEAQGHGQWGGAIQDDITDAVRFVVSQGTADADRVCIFGASFGGYSAMMSAAREPSLYRCAIGLAGLYDLELAYTRGDIPRISWGREYLKQVIGEDEALLQSWSPVMNADKISAAVMLIHGGKDARVPPVHAQRMRKALRKAGNNPGWIYKATEGHGFFNQRNVEKMFADVLAFLDKHTAKR